MMMTERPQPDEYAPVHYNYISLTGNSPILETLDSLKNSTYQLFTHLPAEKANYAYAEGKWTMKQIVGHLIDTERVFAYRAYCISRGEKQRLPGFDQDEYMQDIDFTSRTLADLAEEFKAVRTSNLYFLKALSDKEWLTKGSVSDYTLSVRALAHMMAGHELHHLKIINERYLA